MDVQVFHLHVIMSYGRIQKVLYVQEFEKYIDEKNSNIF